MGSERFVPLPAATAVFHSIPHTPYPKAVQYNDTDTTVTAESFFKLSVGICRQKFGMVGIFVGV